MISQCNPTKQPHEQNFGKQRIGPEPSTVDKALKQKHIKQLYRYTVVKG